MLFIAILILKKNVTSIPTSLYKNFVIEEKYGFNKMTPKLFFKDMIIGYLVIMAILSVFLYIYLYIVSQFEALFFVYVNVSLGLALYIGIYTVNELCVPQCNRLSSLFNLCSTNLKTSMKET